MFLNPESPQNPEQEAAREWAAAERLRRAVAMGDEAVARRDAQLLSVAWRAWHFSAQLHHLVDHYCGVAARDELSQGIRSAFSLVLCPCAMRAVHKGEPVECSCGGATPERAQQAAAGPQGRDDVSESAEEAE